MDEDENFNLEDIVTPVNVEVFTDYLKQSCYEEAEIRFIERGFRFGFEIGYEGQRKIMRTANNLPFICGDKTILWNKVMKEVRLGRYAGPYENTSI